MKKFLIKKLTVHHSPFTTNFMFCTKCGAQNSETAIYCRKCGVALEADDEETRVVRREKIAPPVVIEPNETEDFEKQIFSISPTLMFVKIGYAAAALGALLLVALLSFFSQLTKIEIPVWLSVFAGLALLLIPAFYHLKQKTQRYTLTDAKIEIDEGLVSKQTRNVPLRTIQDVTVASTITQRMLGFGNLIIDNASETGGKIVLKNIDSPNKYAEVMLKQMRRLNK